MGHPHVRIGEERGMLVTARQAGLGTWDGRCCECGTVVMAPPDELVSRFGVCAACARGMASSEMVRRSHEHERIGHRYCRCGGPSRVPTMIVQSARCEEF